MFQKVEDGNGGKWVMKKKFAFAAVSLFSTTVIAFKGMALAASIADITILLTAYATSSGGVLALIFSADIVDKKLNNGTYGPVIKE